MRRHMEEIDRYSRQTVLERIGKAGQRKLVGSKVTIIGLGALGTTIATLLARAGIGHLRLIDRDVVELVNLQRQILYEEEDVGFPKAVKAAKRLRRVNSTIEIEDIAKDVNYSNVLELIKGSDLIMDGTDNIETRFLVNEACIKLGLPWVYGGAIGTEGRVFAIVPKKTACFRCFSRVPPPGLIPTCETVGILNSVATATASLEVTEAMKLILGEEPSGNMLVLDGWPPDLLAIKIKRNKECPICIGGKKEFLDTRKPQIIATLCGGNTISFDPLYKGKIDLRALEKRLKKVGKARMAGPVLIFEIGQQKLTIFQDGRGLINGVKNEEEARSLYSKYVGL